ncbi:MAG: PEP-utilizing enzyme [Burkholderiales bacterium]
MTPPMPRPLMYLLAGNGSAANWWDDALPHFAHYYPVPIELPGYGSNPAPPCHSLSHFADALLATTLPGQAIFAVGVNALVVLHALQKKPGHFARTVLLAPVGVYLWQRRLPALMAPRPVRTLVHALLSHQPAWFARQFSSQRWSPAQYQRMGQGYARCRAFLPLWDMVRPDTALPLLEWITDPIELVWGGRDAVLDMRQAAAWSAVLARAQLTVTLHKHWGHYPWIDHPADTVAWLEGDTKACSSTSDTITAHSKGGRLQLALMADLPVPPAINVTHPQDPRLPALLAQQPAALWAVRSSNLTEDQADAANSGLSTTFLRVSASDVPNKVHQLLAQLAGEVVVQRFVTPVLSGIAFVRHLAVEIEWAQGHLEVLANGQCTPQRAVLSRLGGDWNEGQFPTQAGLSAQTLWQFLQSVLHTFHYVHGDVEWAWDGKQLWLLQYRPISGYGWRRHLTAANVAEILPPQPSRLIEYAQRRAAGSIPAIMARWDTRVLQDNEPFTALFANASYINNDLFLARLADWGMPTRRYAHEVGGSVPALPWRPWRLLCNLPLLWRMQTQSRKALLNLSTALAEWDAELAQLHQQDTSGQRLADWLVRFYVFVVQGNLCIATALASSGGSVWGQPATAYQDLHQALHRLPWESDPATPRPSTPIAMPLQNFPVWPIAVRWAWLLGLPSMRGYCVQVREWYRDNLMRIFLRLHHAMPNTDRAHWFAAHPDARTQQGSFWQDGHSKGSEIATSFVIYPGSAEGVVGTDILLEDTLDPGCHAQYQQALAVVVRMGGRLSHGATLLRELHKPSAVVPDPPRLLPGQRVRYDNGQLTLLETHQESI